MSVKLLSNVNGGEAERVAQAVLDRIAAKQPIAIDGGDVERIGLAGLQVLLAARRNAAASDIPFAIEPCSDPLSDMASLAGLDDLLIN